jgi:exocyst complex component 3
MLRSVRHRLSANLQRMTASHPLKPAKDGTLWTASDVEFFRLLNEQLEAGGAIDMKHSSAVESTDSVCVSA